MTKEALKQQLQTLKLDKEFETLLFELIDETKDVTPTLLNTVADLLDTQANFYLRSAQVHAEEAEVLGTLDEELRTLDTEEYAEKLEAIYGQKEETQQQIVENIQSPTAAPIELSYPPIQTTSENNHQDAQKINDIQSSLSELSNQSQ